MIPQPGYSIRRTLNEMSSIMQTSWISSIKLDWTVYIYPSKLQHYMTFLESLGRWQLQSGCLWLTVMLDKTHRGQRSSIQHTAETPDTCMTTRDWCITCALIPPWRLSIGQRKSSELMDELFRIIRCVVFHSTLPWLLSCTHSPSPTVAESVSYRTCAGAP